jgi:hypothetical protein
MLELLKACGELTMYIMGVSFILGSLITVFSLLILDFVKKNREEKKASVQSSETEAKKKA